ncbi:MAG: response regulator, partial [Chryseolinea sp.]
VAILIDDDADDLEILKDIISMIDESIVCLSFIYPEQAIIAISNGIIAPDFLFIDINMPKMNGDKVLKHIRKDHGFDHTVITMFSTSMPENVAKALAESGANFTYQKPARFEDYNKILTTVLGV